MKILGLDVGEKRIGVARADSSTRIAVPVGFIEVNGSEWNEIARLSRLHSTSYFVVGLPRSNEGNETAQSMYVRQFAKTLVEKVPGAKVRFQDESLTSVVAEERLRARRKVYEKGEIDAEAASIILQDFLEGFSKNSINNGAPQPTTAESAKNENSTPLNTVKNAMADARDNVAGMTKKETDKVLLNTKKVKHKMKTSTKWISAIIVLVVLALLGGGGYMLYNKIKEDRARERQEEYARQEAEMKAEVFNFMIRPGENIYEVRKSLIEVGYPATEVDAALGAQYDFSMLQGRPEGATLEGFLYGETHEFYKTAPATEVIETFLKGMQEVIDENGLQAKYEALGLSLFEGITLASIVQKEAPSPEQPTVAQVFLSRLQNGMALGSDVTVSYALDVANPDRDRDHDDNQAALTVDSCYNTRANRGLPCGPISNPGLSALLAVANPADTSYLYFLTGDDGLMYYSYTESEHNQNIVSHCQELCNVSL